MKTRQVVILVGGKGNRAKPFTLVKPKPLLKVCNKTILEHNLDQLNGIVKEVILVVGYKGNLIRDFIGKRYKNLKIKYVLQKRQLGTGHAVKKALPYIKDKFILMHGDDLYDRADILRCLENFPCILLAQTAKAENFGQVLTEKKFIKELVEKPKKHLSCLVNCGFYFLDKSIFDFKIKKSPRGEYEFTDYIKNLIKKRKICWTSAKKWTPFSLSSNLIKENNFLIKKPLGICSKVYVIGIDGGGIKTKAALADSDGKILAESKTGSASPRNVGLKKAIENIALAIEKVLKKKYRKISLTFLGLPTTEEEFKFRKHIIKREFLKHKEISPIFKGKVIIGSDQLVGFRAGTDEKEGIVLISGSGGVAHGWSKNKEVKVAGWGYLASQGSAFSVGQKGLLAVWKDLDGRGPRTLITKLIFQKFKIKNKENLNDKIYFRNPIKIVSDLSILVEKAGQKNDRVAKNILSEVGKEAVLSANTVIKKLNLQKIKFPLVLIGSMFKSKIILNTVQKEIRKTAPKAEFIRPKEPAKGAVKLAIEELKNQ